MKISRRQMRPAIKTSPASLKKTRNLPIINSKEVFRFRETPVSKGISNVLFVITIHLEHIGI